MASNSLSSRTWVSTLALSAQLPTHVFQTCPAGNGCLQRLPNSDLGGASGEPGLELRGTAHESLWWKPGGRAERDRDSTAWPHVTWPGQRLPLRVQVPQLWPRWSRWGQEPGSSGPFPSQWGWIQSPVGASFPVCWWVQPWGPEPRISSPGQGRMGRTKSAP